MQTLQTTRNYTFLRQIVFFLKTNRLFFVRYTYFYFLIFHTAYLFIQSVSNLIFFCVFCRKKETRKNVVTERNSTLKRKFYVDLMLIWYLPNFKKKALHVWLSDFKKTFFSPCLPTDSSWRVCATLWSCSIHNSIQNNRDIAKNWKADKQSK